MDKEEFKLMNADRLPGAFPDIAQTWAMLQNQVYLKPIRTETDYQNMIRLANELADHLNGDEQDPLADLFAIVSDLIERWEASNVTIPKAEPREVLRHLLETHNLKQKDLMGIASPTVVSDILAGRRVDVAGEGPQPILGQPLGGTADSDRGHRVAAVVPDR